MNIAEKMRELISKLKQDRFNGRLIPLSAECEDMWSEDYAICVGCYFEAEIGDDEPYRRFDRGACQLDFEESVVKHFGDHPGVTVNCYWNSQELEVYRDKDTKEKS